MATLSLISISVWEMLSQFYPKQRLGNCIKSFRYAIISLILSAQQIWASEKSILFGSLAISVKIELADTFQAKSSPGLAIKFLLLGYTVQTQTW